MYLNPIKTKSDQHLISPYSNTSVSFVKIMIIIGNDRQPKRLWLLKEFSLSLPREIYRNWVENMERILGYKGIPFVKKKKPIQLAI